jgi:hypothetical protein
MTRASEHEDEERDQRIMRSEALLTQRIKQAEGAVRAGNVNVFDWLHMRRKTDIVQIFSLLFHWLGFSKRGKG